MRKTPVFTGRFITEVIKFCYNIIKCECEIYVWRHAAGNSEPADLTLTSQRTILHKDIVPVRESLLLLVRKVIIVTSKHSDLLAWKPASTSLPSDWLDLAKSLRQEVKTSPHAYVLKMRYNAQRVGDLLLSWGLPWQVVMAGYLWDYDEEQICVAHLSDAETVLRYINEANAYIRDIEDENLPLLLFPPYRNTGALLLAVAICFQALQELRDRSHEQVYSGDGLAHIKSVGDTLLNIAIRLGMWLFRYDIEDLLEQLHGPRRFAEASREHTRLFQQDQQLLENACQLFMQHYHSMTDQSCVVCFVPCGVVAMQRRQQDAHTSATTPKSHLTGFDLVTFVVIVPTVQDCYATFGILSQLGHLQDRMLDLIANPKSNGCSHLGFGLTLTPDHPRTLGLSWLRPHGLTCQLQISTNFMYAMNWYGCLHPDFYQLCMASSNSMSAPSIPANAALWHSKEGNVFHTLREGLRSSSTDIHAPIVVYDKNRQPVALPMGSTALDFAYRVDKDLGEHAVEAFINNRQMPLYRKLDASDVVEIRISPESQVQDYWLTNDYAITPLARSLIHKSLDHRYSDRRGYHLLLQELEHNHYRLTPEEMDTELRLLVSRYQLGTSQSYLSQLVEKGEAKFTPAWAAQEIIQQREEQNVQSSADKTRANWTPIIDMLPTATKKPFRKLRFCDFCQPSYPHDSKIMGQFRNRSGALTVHKESCPQLIDHEHASVLLPMSWQLRYLQFRVTFYLLAHDRNGLVFDISNLLRRYLCRFIAIQGEAGDVISGRAWVRCTIDVGTETDALDIWQELEQIRNVAKVEIDAAHTPRNIRNQLLKLHAKQRHILVDEASPELIWEELLPMPPPRNAILKNPFDISRPASAKMFFGRAQETRIMQRELCDGERGKTLILYGPRRSGKSSLCRNFLDLQVKQPFWGVHVSLQNSTHQSDEMILASLCREIAFQFRLQLGQPGLDWSNYQEDDALLRFRHILQDYCAQFSHARLVLVLDEFGGALDAYEYGLLSYRFFAFWKELMNDVLHFSLILALPTSSHTVLTRAFSHAFSFAETLPVVFLDTQSAEQLLVDPLQDQHILIRPHTVTLATKLTGGNPYYMTLIGQCLLHLLNREKEKQLVTDDDLHLVVQQLIEEGSYQNFDFLRSELQCPEEFLILQAIVELSSKGPPTVQLKRIASWLHLPDHIVRQHLDRLRIGLILQENGPTSNPFYSFRIDLLRLWLARNRWFFTAS